MSSYSIFVNACLSKLTDHEDNKVDKFNVQSTENISLNMQTDRKFGAFPCLALGAQITPPSAYF